MSGRPPKNVLEVSLALHRQEEALATYVREHDSEGKMYRREGCVAIAFMFSIAVGIAGFVIWLALKG